MQDHSILFLSDLRKFWRYMLSAILLMSKFHEIFCAYAIISMNICFSLIQKNNIDIFCVSVFPGAGRNITPSE